MAPIDALVKRELLAWARRSANLEPLAAARKIKVPEGRVEEWERGTSRPTIAELREAAKVYNRPLGVFFLPEPPQGFETLRDFRRLVPTRSGAWSAALHAEYRRAHLQREALLEIAELDDVKPPQDWHLDRLEDSDSALAAGMRNSLLRVAPQLPLNSSSNEYAHLNFWSAALEEAGILVMATEGGLVLPSEMRAFSLYFERIPVIVLNGADWPRGRLFSLMHEYAHLLLHTAGLCDTTTDTKVLTENRQIEARCNALAAEVLMPADAVLAVPQVLQRTPDDPWSLHDLMEAAKPLGVSVEAFLRRLVTLGRVPLADYQEFRRANARSDAVRPEASGGNFYYTKSRDLGKGYVRVVTDAYRRALVDSNTAATYLGVKVSQISRLAEVARL